MVSAMARYFERKVEFSVGRMHADRPSWFLTDATWVVIC